MVKTDEDKMNTEERIQIIQRSVDYARRGKYTCLNCLSYNPGHDTSGLDSISAYGPTKKQLAGLANAIEKVGIESEEANAFFKKEHIPVRIRDIDDNLYVSIDCVDVDRHVNCLAKLIKEKYGDKK